MLLPIILTILLFVLIIGWAAWQEAKRVGLYKNHPIHCYVLVEEWWESTIENYGLSEEVYFIDVLRYDLGRYYGARVYITKEAYELLKLTEQSIGKTVKQIIG